MTQRKIGERQEARPARSGNNTERKQAEEALRRSEATYREIFNATNDGIIVLDIETGEIVDANATFLNVFGYAAEEARGLRVGDFSSGTAAYTQEDALRLIRKAARGQPQRFEWLAKSGDGRLLWIDVTLKQATIAGRGRVLAIGRDITERKRSEEALRESEGKFRTLTETAAASIFIYRGMRPLYINTAMERLTGYTREEILAGELWQFVHPDFQSLVRERSRARQQGEEAPSRYEFKIVTKSGDERWVGFTAGMIEFEGQPAVIGTAYDITERKRAEEALRASEATYRSIFNTTNDIIVVHDIETGEIVDANATFRNVFGYAPEEARGLRMEDFSSGEPACTQENVLRLIHKAARGQPQRFEWLAKDRDGRLLWIDVTLRRATIAGQDRVLAVGHDITERKRAEEALREEKDRAQQYLDVAGVMFLAIDADERVSLVNMKGCEVLGYEAGEIISKNWFDTFLPGRIREGVRAVFSQLVAGDIPPVEYFENPVLTKKGEERTIAWHNTLLRNETGRICGTLSSGEDITERKRAEEALRETRDYLEKLIDYANAPIIVWDPNFTIARFNHAFERLTGRPPGEVVGQRLEVLFPEAERAASMEQIVRALRGEFWELIEIPILHQNGEVRRVLWNSANIAGPDGRTLVATIAQGTDITERKQAEEALRQSEERYRLLAENVTDVIWTADMDLNYTYISPSRQLLGQAPGQPMPQRVEEALTPASFEIVMKALAEELATENMDEKDLSRSRTLELENYRSDGSTIWVEDRMTFLRDPDGRPVGILGVTRDITERKRAEEALWDSERRFRTLAEASFEGIAIHRKGTMIEANQALAATFGYELSEAIRMHVLDFVAPESRDAVLQSIVSKSQEPFEFTGLRKNGTTFPVEVCGRPIPYQGQMVTVASLRDITERKQAEEALEKAREELEARVEHQMEQGNPYGLTFRELTVLHVVAAGKADKEIGGQLGISTLTASKHLANILSKMGAASRTEAGVRALREGLLD